MKIKVMKSNQLFSLAYLICISFFLLIACKKENPLAATDSIYGTYAKAEGGQICISSVCWPNLSVVTIMVAPINSIYIKITIPGYLNRKVYDSVKLTSSKSFSIDQRINGYHVFGSGNFGSKKISLEIRDDFSRIVHIYDNIPKLYDYYYY